MSTTTTEKSLGNPTATLAEFFAHAEQNIIDIPTFRGVWHLDKPGGLMRPGLDQIPSTCTDYYCVQDGAAYLGGQCGVTLTTLDAPLIHLGDTRLWQYSTAIVPKGPAYSWLTNNKWECNFPLDTGGNFEFRYVLEACSHPAPVCHFPINHCWRRIPMTGRGMNARCGLKTAHSRWFIRRCRTKQLESF